MKNPPRHARTEASPGPAPLSGWTLPEGESDLIALARGYPYTVPRHSYVFADGGTVRPLDAEDEAVFHVRVPVVACGSNRSPQQLRRKFGHLRGETAEIPVTRAWLADYDVVYSAHITRYGSIAASLHHVAGTRAEVYVTWLTESQLDHMHATEFGSGNYAFGRLRGVDLLLDGAPLAGLQEVFTYLSLRGAWNRAGGPVGLRAVGSLARTLPHLDQAEALAEVHGAGPDELDGCILRSIREASVRNALTRALSRRAVATNAPHFETLAKG